MQLYNILLVRVLAHSRLSQRRELRDSRQLSHVFPDWQECTGAYGDKRYFDNFKVLGCQPGNKISFTVSLRNGESTAETAESQQVFFPFYAPFECFYHIIHAIICSCQSGKAAWLGMNHTFAKGANELNALTKSMYIMIPLLSLPTLSTVNWTCFSPLLVFRASPNWIQYAWFIVTLKCGGGRGKEHVWSQPYAKNNSWC